MNYNGEHFAIHQVINMTSHGGPFLNTLDMININQQFYKSPLGHMRLIKSTPLVGL